MKPGMKTGTSKIFYARLARLGTLHLYKERYKELKQGPPPRTNVQTRWIAMKEFGYVDAATEWRIHEEYLSKVNKNVEEEMAERKERQKAAKKLQSSEELFERAVNGLAPTASETVDNDWIRAHAAMARKARGQVDTEGTVLITADDVLKAPHGPAPSKAAVYALQHWANFPHKFYEKMRREKKDEEGGGAEWQVDDLGLEEFERLIKEAGG